MRPPREHCLSILTAMHGRELLPTVLMTPQPGLEGKTIAEMLQNRPKELLEKLLNYQPGEQAEP